MAPPTTANRYRPAAAWAAGILAIPWTAIAVYFGTRHNVLPWPMFWLSEAIGLPFMLAGWLLWRRHIAGGIGPLMMAAGIAWYAGNLQYSGVQPLYYAGLWLYYLPLPIFCHLMLIYPTGARPSGPRRVLIVTAYTGYLVLQGGRLLAESDRGPIGLHEPLPQSLWADTLSIFALLLTVITFVLVARHWRATRPGPARRPYEIVWWVVAGIGATMAAHTIASTIDASIVLQRSLYFAYGAGLLCLPIAIAAGTLRVAWARRIAADIVEHVADSGDLLGLQRLLATELGDSDLKIGLWSPERGQYLDGHGKPVDLPSPAPGRVVHHEVHAGSKLAFIEYDAALTAQPALIKAVLAAIKLVLLQARQVAELRASRQEILDSREAIVKAVLDERRKMAQELHHGLQNLFTDLQGQTIRARAICAGGAIPADIAQPLTDHLERMQAVIGQLDTARRETELGVYPTVLGTRGLAAAVTEMAFRRTDLAIDNEIEFGGHHVDSHVQQLLYLTVAEAITNAVKHGNADHAVVKGHVTGGRVVIEIHDNGSGQARPKPDGGGLAGLIRDVEALHGRLTIPPTSVNGTTIRVEMPCEL